MFSFPSFLYVSNQLSGSILFEFPLPKERSRLKWGFRNMFSQVFQLKSAMSLRSLVLILISFCARCRAIMKRRRQREWSHVSSLFPYHHLSFKSGVCILTRPRIWIIVFPKIMIAPQKLLSQKWIGIALPSLLGHHFGCATFIGNGNRDHATSSKRWRLERFI